MVGAPVPAAPGHQDRGISQPARAARAPGPGRVAVLQGTQPGIVHGEPRPHGGVRAGRGLEQTCASPHERTLGRGAAATRGTCRKETLLRMPLRPAGAVQSGRSECRSEVELRSACSLSRPAQGSHTVVRDALGLLLQRGAGCPVVGGLHADIARPDPGSPLPAQALAQPPG